VSKERWNGMKILVKEDENEWLRRSYIVRINNMSNRNDIKETFILNGLNFICIRYMGDNVMFFFFFIIEGEKSIKRL